jgi:hypothetical protein
MFYNDVALRRVFVSPGGDTGPACAGTRSYDRTARLIKRGFLSAPSSLLRVERLQL